MGGGRCLVKQNGPQTSLEGNHDKHVSGTHQAPSQWRPQWKKAQILSKKNISEDSSGNGIDILKSKTERIIREISTVINLSSEKYKGGSFWSHIKHTRSDKSGFSSLMPGCDKVTDLTTKAKLLNDQFQRAFYKIVPMKLKHICWASNQCTGIWGLLRSYVTDKHHCWGCSKVIGQVKSL